MAEAFNLWLDVPQKKLDVIAEFFFLFSLFVAYLIHFVSDI